MALGEAPAVVRLGWEFGLAVEHLFSGLAEVFGHGQVKLRGQPLDLVINRVGKLHFGSFQGENLAHAVGFGQSLKVNEIVVFPIGAIGADGALTMG